MKRQLLASLAGIFLSATSYAQFSDLQNNNLGPTPFVLSSDNNTMEIRGRASFYYQNRFLKQGNNDLKHNGFDVKDADIDFFGKTASKFTYEFHLSIVDLVTSSAHGASYDPTNPGVKAAYLQYTGFLVHVKLGYDKLPFSQGSLSEVWGTPMWSHANLFGGDFFSRRDLGLTLQSRLWKSRINLYAGVYSGMGENFFEYGNDASGRFEYIGRAEFSYPGKMKYHIIDEENSSVFRFRVAANARYTDKSQPDGGNIIADYPDMPGMYGVRMVNGKRGVYGADAMVKYKGISATFETDMMRIQPANNNDPLYYGTAGTFNGKYINAGGYCAGLNYDWQKIRSVFSVMYEDFNANDLAINASSAHTAGQQAWLYLGYAYMVNGFGSVFKIEYYRPAIESTSLNSLKYYGQVRIGYQVTF